GVDIESCSDTISNGYNVGWIENGEWLQYTVNNISEGMYNMGIRSSSKDSTGELKILINDVAVSTAILPQTNENQKWQTTVVKNVKFVKGINRITLLAVKGGFNLNYLKFMRTGIATH
ncbi:MAG TPA: carbohydrate-binding protein, partial [Chitinophagaceae bacterium]|nr:carbohydrate-binding protein [Chitinophagaceae bacterium]